MIPLTSSSNGGSQVIVKLVNEIAWADISRGAEDGARIEEEVCIIIWDNDNIDSYTTYILGLF